MGIVSRGGALLAKWMMHHGRENPMHSLWDEICEMVQEFGGLDYSHQMAARYGDEAKERLLAVAAHPQAAVLADAVDYVLRRLD